MTVSQACMGQMVKLMIAKTTDVKITAIENDIVFNLNLLNSHKTSDLTDLSKYIYLDTNQEKSVT